MKLVVPTLEIIFAVPVILRTLAEHRRRDLVDDAALDQHLNVRLLRIEANKLWFSPAQCVEKIANEFPFISLRLSCGKRRQRVKLELDPRLRSVVVNISSQKCDGHDAGIQIFKERPRALGSSAGLSP